jgi:hypothetical protein
MQMRRNGVPLVASMRIALCCCDFLRKFVFPSAQAPFAPLCPPGCWRALDHPTLTLPFARSPYDRVAGVEPGRAEAGVHLAKMLLRTLFVAMVCTAAVIHCPYHPHHRMFPSAPLVANAVVRIRCVLLMPWMRLHFDISGFKNGSPAIILRANLLNVEKTDAGEIPYLQSWANGLSPEGLDEPTKTKETIWLGSPVNQYVAAKLDRSTR